MVDLDNNIVTPDPTVPPLPDTEAGILRRSLKDNLHPQILNLDYLDTQNDVCTIWFTLMIVDKNLFDKNSVYQRNIRATFLMVFASLFTSYKEYYTEDDQFDRLSFAADQSILKKVLFSFLINLKSFNKYNVNLSSLS